MRVFVFSLYFKETIISTVWYVVLGTYGDYRYVQYFLFIYIQPASRIFALSPRNFNVLLFALL